MATTRPMNLSIPNDIWDFLASQENRSAYVANLVRQDQKSNGSMIREVANDLVSDLTQLLCEIDEMGNAGHHVEQIRKQLDENKNLAKLVELL